MGPSEVEQVKQLVRNCGYHPSLLYQLVSYLHVAKLSLETFLHSPAVADVKSIAKQLSSEEKKLFFKMLYQTGCLEATKQLLIMAPEEVAQELKLLPSHSSGLKFFMLEKEQQLRSYTEEIVTDVPGEVKVTSAFWEKPRYLKPDIVAFDEAGNITPLYPDAAHFVARTSDGRLHLKQKPTQPLLEYAIYNLTSRIAGYLMPATELVSFEVKGKRYPVLVSETIQGVSLRNAINDPKQPFNSEQWTWHLLCSLLMRPGDGHLSNYILAKTKIFCIDNDYAFVEPVVDKGKYFSDYYVQFFSALFCLKIDLNPDVLKAFCQLDIDAIIAGWMEDLIEKEKQYAQLFSAKEKEDLYNQSPNPGFKPSILFQKGTLATLLLQYWQLHDYISHGQVSIEGLLKQLIRLDSEQKVVPIGGHVSKAYAHVKPEELYAKLKKVKPTEKREPSMTPSEHQIACFGKPLSFAESEKKEFSPQEAKAELFQTLVKGSKDFTETQLTLTKNFTNCTRPEWVLTAMAHRIQRAPQIIQLLHCSILTSSRLEPFLHTHLQVLDLRFCAQIDKSSIGRMASCLKLKKLRISHTEKLTDISTYFFYALEFPALEVLSISHCNNLSTFRIKALNLRKLSFTHNTQSFEIHLEAPKLFKMDFRHSDQISLSPASKLVILDALARNPANMVNAPNSIKLETENALKVVKANPGTITTIHLVFELMKVLATFPFRRGKGISDREIVLAAVKQRGEALQYAAEQLKRDREVVLVAVKQSSRGGALQYAAEELKRDREFILAAVKQNSGALQYAAEEFKHDREVVLAGVKHYGWALQYAAEEFKRDREVVLAAVKANGMVLEYAAEEFKHDREFVLAAVKQSGGALKYAAEEFKRNREFILVAVKANGMVLEYAAEEFKHDREIVLAAVKQRGGALQYAAEEFKGDREVALVGVNQFDFCLEHVAKEFKRDREIVLAAVKANGMVLEYAAEELKHDKEIVLAAVKHYGCALEYAAEEFKRDREIVLTAVKQSGVALKYAAEEFKHDREIVLGVVKAHGWALQYAAEEFKRDREVVLAAVKQRGEALYYAAEELKRDREIVLAAVKQSGEALQYAAKEFKRDKDIQWVFELSKNKVTEVKPSERSISTTNSIADGKEPPDNNIKFLRESMIIPQHLDLGETLVSLIAELKSMDAQIQIQRDRIIHLLKRLRVIRGIQIPLEIAGDLPDISQEPTEVDEALSRIDKKKALIEKLKDFILKLEKYEEIADADKS